MRNVKQFQKHNSWSGFLFWLKTERIIKMWQFSLLQLNLDVVFPSIVIVDAFLNHSYVELVFKYIDTGEADTNDENYWTLIKFI